MYYLLTESFKEQERKLAKTILGSVLAHSIYLLGSILATRRTESIFMTDAPSCSQVSHYHILVLVSDEQDVNIVQDIIENRCRNWIPVTAIVLRTSIFNTWLAEGHRFVHTVCKIAMLLYGSKPSIPAEAELPEKEMIQQPTIK